MATRIAIASIGLLASFAALGVAACNTDPVVDDGPPPPPTCCGCLCKDATWSCTKETCVDDDGKATALLPEAGFFELPGADYVSYKGAGQTPRARVWYAFQPAESAPEEKPLVILFNGVTGPALALMALNTGHFTLDPLFTSGADFAENPSRWTDFANLLYLDEPGAGWSYFLPRADGSRPPERFDAYAQAGDHLRVVMRFVTRHPQLAKAPILIAGESGGGLKGAYMTKIMLDYPTLVGGGTYQDAALHTEIVEFLGARRADIAPTAWTPADIVGVFTHQIFINPYLTAYQWDDFMTLDPTMIPGCVDPPDPLDCSETLEEAEAAFAQIGRVGTTPDLLSQVLRCDVKSVAWLHPDQRIGEYPRPEGGAAMIDQAPIVAALGALEPGVNYYVLRNAQTFKTWDLGPNPPENEEHGRVSLRSLHDIPTLITRGRYDLLYNSEFLPKAFSNYTDVVSSVTRNDAAPAGTARPGQIEITYAAGLSYGGGTIVIPNPPYDSGHAVSHHAHAELKADVQAFLME